MIYLNDRLVPEKKALVSVFDHGFLYGDGIYETLRAYKGTVFMIDEHIERLFRSASMIGLDLPKGPEGIKEAVYETIRANRRKEAYVRITVSRGPGSLGLDPALCPEPTFVIMANEFKGYPRSYYQKGIDIAIVDTRRNYKKALDPQIKSLNFLNNVLAKIEAKDRGAYEAVMLNNRGYLAEGTVSNIFFIRKRILCTPAIGVGILDGITRRVIIEAAADLGIEVNEGRFRAEDLRKADEVFISNTTMEIMPVAKVDDKKMPAKFTLTRQLHKAYNKKITEYMKEGSR